MKLVASFWVSPDGRTVVAPVVLQPDRFRYVVEVEGTFSFDYTGQTFDALYATDPKGEFVLRHEFFRLSPGLQLLESKGGHRYRFLLRPEFSWEPLAFRVDVERFVDTYLLSPLEVRRQLHGGLRVRIWQAPLRPGWVEWLPWPALLAVLGTAWAIRRRQQMARGMALEPDLAERLARLEQRYRALLQALRTSPVDLSSLEARCQAIWEGAQELAQHLHRLRAARRDLPQERLEEQVRHLEERLAQTTSTALRHELEETLAQHRRTLEAYRRLQEKEERYLLRFAQMEAFLERVQLEIPRLEVAQEKQVQERRLLAAADEELAVLETAVQELAGLRRGE